MQHQDVADRWTIHAMQRVAPIKDKTITGTVAVQTGVAMGTSQQISKGR